MKSSLLDSLYKARERKRRKLVDIDVDEISLVDRTANGHRFAIVKSDAGAEFLELMESFRSEEFTALLKAKDEAGLNKAIERALKLLQPYLQDMPDTMRDAVKLISSYAGAAAGGGYPPNKERASYTDADVEERMSKGADSGFGLLAREICRVSNPALFQKFAKQADDIDEIPDADDEPQDDGRPRRAVSKQVIDSGESEPEGEVLWPSLERL